MITLLHAIHCCFIFKCKVSVANNFPIYVLYLNPSVHIIVIIYYRENDTVICLAIERRCFPVTSYYFLYGFVNKILHLFVIN